MKTNQFRVQNHTTKSNISHIPCPKVWAALDLKYQIVVLVWPGGNNTIRLDLLVSFHTYATSVMSKRHDVS